MPPCTGQANVHHIALRAEADGPEPAVAALPLVTAAANIGELELMYPAEAVPVSPLASAENR